MINRTCVISPIALLLVIGAAQAQKPTKYPAAVQAVITDMNKTCSVMGKPMESPGLVTTVDLTGDGVPDYVIDVGAFQCDGAASLFWGSGGSQMSVYVGTPDG